MYFFLISSSVTTFPFRVLSTIRKPARYFIIEITQSIFLSKKTMIWKNRMQNSFEHFLLKLSALNSQLSYLIAIMTNF